MRRDGVRVGTDMAGVDHQSPAGFMERLPDYSAEVTTPDRKSLDVAAERMPRDARVYVATLPKGTPDRQIGLGLIYDSAQPDSSKNSVTLLDGEAAAHVGPCWSERSYLMGN